MRDFTGLLAVAILLPGPASIALFAVACGESGSDPATLVPDTTALDATLVVDATGPVEAGHPQGPPRWVPALGDAKFQSAIEMIEGPGGRFSLFPDRGISKLV